MARVREFVIGWLKTVSPFDERSFPLGIKSVNIKELLVIFPLALLAIAFAFRDVLLSMVAIAPAVFIVLYDEKSMDEFQFTYYFVKFYVGELMKGKRPTKVKRTEKKNGKKFDVVGLFTRHMDYVQTALGVLAIVFTLPSLPSLKGSPPVHDVVVLSVFGVGLGLLVSEAVVKSLEKRKKRG